MAMWPNGKALDYDSFEIAASRDSRFDPWHGQHVLFGYVSVLSLLILGKGDEMGEYR